MNYSRILLRKNMSDKKLKLEDIEIVIRKYSDDSELLKQYFKLRYEVYHSYNLSYYYKPEATRWDRKDYNFFMLLLDKNTNKVMGGRRFMVHEPNTEDLLYLEINTHHTMQEALPHLDTEQMRYVESGALCFDAPIRGIGAHIPMYKKSFDMMREMEVDFMISSPVPTNRQKIEESARENGIQQIVWRQDVISIEDGDNDPTMFMSFKTEDQLNLTPPHLRSRAANE